MNEKEGLELYNEYSKLQNDRERLQFFISHKDALMIVLDNDNSTGFFKDAKLQEAVDKGFDFSCYFGNAKGVYLLFEQLGILAIPC